MFIDNRLNGRLAKYQLVGKKLYLNELLWYFGKLWYIKGMSWINVSKYSSKIRTYSYKPQSCKMEYFSHGKM